MLGARVDKEPQILPDNPVLKTQRSKQVQTEKQRPPPLLSKVWTLALAVPVMYLTEYLTGCKGTDKWKELYHRAHKTSSR